jgi:hypothetical protein
MCKRSSIRSNVPSCFDNIRNQLRDFNLSEDFDIACELGYGQFIWQPGTISTLRVFRSQAPGITLRLSIDTRIDALSNQCPHYITQM